MGLYSVFTPLINKLLNVPSNSEMKHLSFLIIKAYIK